MNCTTAVKRLDKVCKGRCMIFAAETGFGKSLYAISVASENMDADPDRCVLIVSFEDPRELYADRKMSREARVNANRLAAGKCTKAETERMTALAQKADRRPVFLDATGGSAEWAAKQVGRALDAYPNIRLVIYDYLQEARSDLRHKSRSAEVSYVAKMLRKAALSRKRACLILSQINEHKGKHGRPTIDSIDELKRPGKVADIIALGFEADREHTKPDGSPYIEPGDRCMAVAKTGDGELDQDMLIRLNWNNEYVCFDRS